MQDQRAASVLGTNYPKMTAYLGRNITSSCCAIDRHRLCHPSFERHSDAVAPLPVSGSEYACPNITKLEPRLFCCCYEISTRRSACDKTAWQHCRQPTSPGSYSRQTGQEAPHVYRCTCAGILDDERTVIMARSLRKVTVPGSRAVRLLTSTLCAGTIFSVLLSRR